MRYAHVKVEPYYDGYTVYLRDRDGSALSLNLQRLSVPDGAEHPVAAHLDDAQARDLYVELGRALGDHSFDTKAQAETLKLEQQRVDKLIDFLVSSHD